MLHTSISAYANRNGILARLVALFLLLFTTSGDVLCLKFGGVFETLWIFKVARWAHERCTKINKRHTVSNGVEASSWDLKCKFGSVAYYGQPNKLTELHLWRFKLEILQCVGTKKNWHSDADISDWGYIFLILLFLSKKKSKPVGYTRTLYFQTGKNTK